jgi:mRNA-degrading endonuclease YafQ of YafQ-DinJ toxin-antitoxin module
MATEIKVETLIDVKEYIRLIMILTYRRGIIRFLVLLGVIFLVWSIFSLCGGWYFYGTITYAQLTLAIFILFFLPIVFHRRAKMNFNSNERLKENITYIFSEKQITIRGESFQVEMSWEKIYKIEEIKDWLLIYQNRNSANIIPLRYFSKEILTKFRSLAATKKKNIRS